MWVTWVEVWSDFFLSFFIFGGLVVYIYRTFVLLFAPFWLISCLCFFSAWFFVVFRDVSFLDLFVFCVLMLWLCSSVHFCSVLGVFSGSFLGMFYCYCGFPRIFYFFGLSFLFWLTFFVIPFLSREIFRYCAYSRSVFYYVSDRFTWILSDGFCYHFSHKFICLISLSNPLFHIFHLILLPCLRHLLAYLDFSIVWGYCCQYWDRTFN